MCLPNWWKDRNVFGSSVSNVLDFSKDFNLSNGFNHWMVWIIQSISTVQTIWLRQTSAGYTATSNTMPPQNPSPKQEQYTYLKAFMEVGRDILAGMIFWFFWRKLNNWRVKVGYLLKVRYWGYYFSDGMKKKSKTREKKIGFLIVMKLRKIWKEGGTANPLSWWGGVPSMKWSWSCCCWMPRHWIIWKCFHQSYLDHGMTSWAVRGNGSLQLAP